jgi:hypothetical protein
MVRAISRHLISTATGGLLVLGCGSRQQPAVPNPANQPTPARVLPLSRVILLETSGPPPSDTAVSFTAGSPRIITLRHGPPENIAFARISFSAVSFADSGQTVQVEIRPRPGVYGLDLTTSLPFRSATVEFEYARYFSAPAAALQVYRSNAGYERALAVGRVLADNQIELLSSIHNQLDKVSATIALAGSYLVAAPQ